MQIGKKLRTLRAEKGFTQERIADLLKIPQASYSNLENNKGKLDLNLVKKSPLSINRCSRYFKRRWFIDYSK